MNFVSYRAKPNCHDWCWKTSSSHAHANARGLRSCIGSFLEQHGNAAQFIWEFIREFIRPFPQHCFRKIQTTFSHIGWPRACSSTLLEGVVEINFARSRGLYQTFALAIRARITRMFPGKIRPRGGRNTFWCVCNSTKLAKNSLGSSDNKRF